MSLHPLIATTIACLFATILSAQPVQPTLRADPSERERIGPLMDALQMPAMLEIIREEGIGYADELEEDLFPGRGGDGWIRMVEDIYETGRMELMMRDGLGADLDPWHIDPLLDFFTSETGTQIVALELGARRAMLDPDVEAASADILAQMRATGAARLETLEEFAAANDLIERNVVGALNANFAFYTGLNGAGAFGDFMGEEDMLREIWSQEAEIREQTDTWLFSYLAMAYQPLSDEDLRAYISLSQTDAGQELNNHLFHAFDDMFQALSYDLGMAAARFMAGEDL
ncbi:DUF2059 domain-containing protein [Tropicimonas marinistellae]|uniref:DUF2059 domain-containing protein n=1 Tax=Tropicimonas marinistellae TaxID=1739787 RepID=UPI00082A3C5F|nr:DUF2059 domain-containing protein [Tropicimonas marinistellae]